MKHIFLVNSFSLKDKTEEFKNRITDACKKLKLDYKIEVNSNDYSTEDILHKYSKGKNIIICLGGDGTINRTLNGIVGSNNILGYIPLGTGNDFYRTNKELLNKGINDIDLIKINDKYFINTACFGIDADIANNESLVHSKYIPKSQRYNVSLVKNFFKYKGRDLRIVVRGKEYKDKFNTVVLCNGRYYGGGYRIGKNALLDDGLIDIYLAKKTSKFRLLKLLLNIKSGKHENDKSIEKITASKLYIGSPKNVKCNIDGEMLESNSFDIELIHKGIKIYYNEDLIREIIDKKKEKNDSKK